MTVERIDVERGPVEETPKDSDLVLESLNGRERKVTRNLKRKHDEINHVQKVCIYIVSMYALYNHECIYIHTYVIANELYCIVSSHFVQKVCIYA